VTRDEIRSAYTDIAAEHDRAQEIEEAADSRLAELQAACPHPHRGKGVLPGSSGFGGFDAFPQQCPDCGHQSRTWGAAATTTGGTT